jgi:hypothetical protein
LLDLFGGSGSTLIAAAQTGRRALLMELDPWSGEVIIERYQKFTGGKAERMAATIATGVWQPLAGGGRQNADEVLRLALACGATRESGRKMRG